MKAHWGDVDARVHIYINYFSLATGTTSWAARQVKRRKGWRMSCDVGEMAESLNNEPCSFSNFSVTSPTSQLIQPFRRFTYVTAHSAALPLLHLRHSSFSRPFASTSQALHLHHLASRLCAVCFR